MGSAIARAVTLVPFLSVAWAVSAVAVEMKPETLAAWERYVALTERRIAAELDSGDRFLVGDFFPLGESNRFRETVLSGDTFIRKIETLDEEGKKIRIPSGMVQHWYGCIFVPGVRLDAVVEWARSYDDRHKVYDEVEDSRLLSVEGDLYHVFLRLKRTKLITVHYNTEHVVTFRNYGKGRLSSKSRSTKIAELEDPGTPREREKPPGSDRGFLWRLNSYWRYEEVANGVMVDCETVTLSRDVPVAMEWMIKSFLESVPEESLRGTLEPIVTLLSGPTR